MSKQIGSQYRETLKEAGYKLVSWSAGEAILEDSDGKKELWFVSDDHSGYTVELPNGFGYEFARSLEEQST